MPGSTGNQGPGSQLSLGTIVALLAGGIAAIIVTTLTISGSAVFTASSAPTGEAAKSKIWHDSTTNRLMSNVANAGARYVTDTGGYTTNTLPKASGVGTLADSSITDDGTNVTAYGRQVRVGAAPVTADADAMLLIQAPLATDVPLVVQGAAGQSDNLVEAKSSDGVNVFAVSQTGAISGLNLSGPSQWTKFNDYGLGLGTSSCITFTNTSNGWSGIIDASIWRRAVNTIGFSASGGNGEDALRIGVSGRIYGNAVANPTPHATASNHTSNGTLVTLTTTAAHNLVAGQTVTLAGWTWADGGGVVNGTFYVNTVPSTTTLTINPATCETGVCPTTGTNPAVVGTMVVNATLQLGTQTTYASPKAVSIGGTVHLNLASVPAYANNAAAIAGGLVQGDLYRTNADPDTLCIVH